MVQTSVLSRQSVVDTIGWLRDDVFAYASADADIFHDPGHGTARNPSIDSFAFAFTADSQAMIALTILLQLLLTTNSHAFHTPTTVRNGFESHAQSRTSTPEESHVHVSRRDALMQGVVGGLSIISTLLVSPSPVRADVWDGNTLPKGAAEFSRVLRLTNDLPAVRKRLETGGEDIDKKEWENIGRFLSVASAVVNGMKGIADGIADPDKKQRALEDIGLARQFVESGALAVSRKSASTLIPVLEKLSLILDDFLNCLSDVPDEI